MANGLRIVVLTHEFDEFWKDGYLLASLCREWESRGASIQVAKGGKDAPAGDVAILHPNITRVPDDLQEALQKYPRVVNGAALDISKRGYSDLVLSRSTAHYPGRVIIKTDANFGGFPELKHGTRREELTQDQVAKWTWRDTRCLQKYPVLPNARAVPPDVWENPNLIVERFAPERTDEGDYALRIWIFLGSQSIHYRCLSKEPVIKSQNTYAREQLDPDAVPALLRSKREALGFDYGKFDYVVVRGRVVLLDANRTPGYPTQYPTNEARQARIRALGQGLFDFVERPVGGAFAQSGEPAAQASERGES